MQGMNMNSNAMAVVQLPINFAQKRTARAAQAGQESQIPVVRKKPTLAQAVDALRSAKRLHADHLKPLLVKQDMRLLSPVDHRRDPTVTDLGWAAGILEGEGCIQIVRQKYKRSDRRDTYRIRLDIAQTNKSLLQEFEWAVGLKGNIVSPPPKDKQTRTCHSLIYQGLAAIVVLTRLRMMLKFKRAQCELALEFQEKCEIHRHWGPNGCPQEIWELRHWYYERMQRIKRDLLSKG